MAFDGEKFGNEIVEAVKRYVDRQLQPIKGQIKALEAGNMKFCGVHQRAMDYRKGSVVTDASGLWVALQDVPEGIKPGTSPEHWQLALKGTKP